MQCCGLSLNPPPINPPLNLPGGEQTFVRVLSVPLQGGVRGGFIVPMHAQERKVALHEPSHSSSSSFSFSSSTSHAISSFSRTSARTRKSRFMVRIWVQNDKGVSALGKGRGRGIECILSYEPLCTKCNRRNRSLFSCPLVRNLDLVIPSSLVIRASSFFRPPLTLFSTADTVRVPLEWRWITKTH